MNKIDIEYVEWYCRAIHDATARYFQEQGWTHDFGMFYPEYGRRFTRIVHENGTQRSVHAFVDMTNGDVVKAATWNSPQQGKYGLAARFNLVEDESRERGFRAVDPFGYYLYDGALDNKANASIQ